MTPTLADHLDDLDDRDSAAAERIRTIKRRVETRRETNLDKVEIKSVDEMGEAAGTCVIETGEICLRADLVAANNTDHYGELDEEMLEHALEHEAGHQGAKQKRRGKKGGMRSEGLDELDTVDTLNVSPVPAYQGYVRAARVIVALLGKTRAMDLACEVDYQLALTQAVFQEKVHRSIPAATAAKEAEELVKAAA